MLTPRQREVVQLLGLGYANKDIARALVIELRTVKKHVGDICARLGLRNRTQIAVWAVRQGLA